MSVLPILMKEADARKYLGGADPSQLIAPIRIGRGKWYSRHALDRAVAERAGLPVAEKPTPGSAYEEWKKSLA